MSDIQNIFLLHSHMNSYLISTKQRTKFKSIMAAQFCYMLLEINFFFQRKGYVLIYLHKANSFCLQA